MNFDNNFKDLFNRFYYHSRLRELTVYLVCLLIVSGLIMLFNGKKNALKKSSDRSDSSYSDYSTSSGYDYSAPSGYDDSSGSGYGANTSNKVDLTPDSWYTYRDLNILHVQNCTVSSASLMSHNVVSLTYRPVCKSCHTASSNLEWGSASPNYPKNKSYYCNECGATTIVKLNVSN